jgi:hypothetical protein
LCQNEERKINKPRKKKPHTTITVPKYNETKCSIEIEIKQYYTVETFLTYHQKIVAIK